MVRSGRLRVTFAILGLVAVTGSVLHDRIGHALIEDRIRRVVAMMPGIGIGSLDLDADRHEVVVRNLRASIEGHDLAIGRLELPLAESGLGSFVGSASAATVPLAMEDVRLAMGQALIVIPHLSATGSSLDAAEFLKTFDAAPPISLDDRIARFSASTVTAAEVSVMPLSEIEREKSVSVVFHGVTLSDIVEGRVGSLAIKETTIADAAKRSDGSFTIGAIDATRIDLPLGLRIARGSRIDAAMPLQPVVESLSIAGTTLEAPDVVVKIGSLRSGPVKGRPPLTPFSDFAALSGKPSAERSETERNRIAKAPFDAMESFAFDHIEARDMTLLSTGNEPGSMQLAAFVMDGLEPGKIRRISADGFALHVAKVDATVTQIALSGYDQSRLLDAARHANSSPDAEAWRGDVTEIMPSLGSLSLRAMTIDASADDLKGNAHKGTRTLVEVPAADMTMARDAADTTSGSSHLRIVYDIAPDVVDPGLINLLQAGFTHLDMSLDTALRWNPATREATLDRLSLSGENMAEVSLGGTFGHLAPALFDTAHGDAAASAAQEIEIEELRLDVKDAGLAARLWDLAAKRAGVSVPLLKAEAKGQVQVAILKAFGDTPTATKISDALTTFIDQPKTLTVSAKAPAGLNIGAIAQSGGGRPLLDLLQIQAKANP